jgi:hypothetical protein
MSRFKGTVYLWGDRKGQVVVGNVSCKKLPINDKEVPCKKTDETAGLKN